MRLCLGQIGLQGGVVALVAEILAGALIYVPAGFVFVPSTARNFLGLLKKMVGRG